VTSSRSAGIVLSSAQRQLVLRATRKALEIRSALQIPLSGAVCARQAVQDLGVDLRYVDIPSMEGMYCRTPDPKILVSSHRPVGRQAFTTCHELGHHVFGHGNHVRELLEQQETARRFTPEERLADTFAAIFLMPKSAVNHAFAIRSISPASCQHADIYAVAWWFGVGYETLVQHLLMTLHLITEERAQYLLRQKPKAIRAGLLGRQIIEDLVPVDFHWVGRAIDCQAGDLILLPSGVRPEGGSVEALQEGPDSVIVKATRPGIGRVVALNHDWAAFVRVSRRAYVGRACYRFLEDEDEEYE